MISELRADLAIHFKTLSTAVLGAGAGKGPCQESAQGDAQGPALTHVLKYALTGKGLLPSTTSSPESGS